MGAEMMHHEVGNAALLTPVAVVITGISGYCYSTVVKFFSETHATIAQAAPVVPGTSFSWADFGQGVGGACALVGGFMMWYLARRADVKESLRQQREKDAESDREIKLQNRLADMQAEHAKHMLEIQEMIARQSGRIDRNDVGIEANRAATQAMGDASK